MWLLEKLLRRVIRDGRLIIIDHDGKEYDFGDSAAEPIRVRLTDKRVVWDIGKDPELGAGEAYMDGRMVIEAPHDIRDLILFVSKQSKAPGTQLKQRNALQNLGHRIASRLDQLNHRARARKNIEHHYDLTRSFYELFLDTDRQYSMAYFRDPANSLERAQIDKKALIAAKLRIEPGMRILDIGGGWGGFALYLNRHYGCEVLGVSLAPDQVRFANERMVAAGVDNKVRFELIDYRDVTGKFDRISSIGMIEHVGMTRYDEYFGKTYDLLADDGVMLTHTIGRVKPSGATDKWNRKYIFPGHYLPSISELSASIERTGWETGDVEVLRYHYANTLAEWYRRAELHREEIIDLYDERFFRMWQFYLAGAEQGFRFGGLVNFHFQTVKQRSALPMTRDYIFEETNRLIGLDEAPDWHLAQAAE